MLLCMMSHISHQVYSANVSRDAVTHKKPTQEFSTSTSAFTIKNKVWSAVRPHTLSFANALCFSWDQG